MVDLLKEKSNIGVAQKSRKKYGAYMPASHESSLVNLPPPNQVPYA